MGSKVLLPCTLLFLLPLTLAKPVHQPHNEKRQGPGFHGFGGFPPFGPHGPPHEPPMTAPLTGFPPWKQTQTWGWGWGPATTMTVDTTYTYTTDWPSSSSAVVTVTATETVIVSSSAVPSSVAANSSIPVASSSAFGNSSLTAISSIPIATSSVAGNASISISSIPVASSSLAGNSSIPAVSSTAQASSGPASSSAPAGSVSSPPASSSPSKYVTTSPSSFSKSPQSTCTSATPPAPTQSGVVAGCIEWHVAVSGEYCQIVADDFGISVDLFMAWNLAVEPPTCQRMLAGYAYCVATCNGPQDISSSASYWTTTSTTTNTVTLFSTTLTITASAPSSTLPTSASASVSSAAPNPTVNPSDKYVSYCGDGSTAQGWPSIDQWKNFTYLFDYNMPNMKIACEAWGVPNDSPSEIAALRTSILSVANITAIDPRFILSIIMQESTGCVRVITTAYSHANPGLMQSFNGTGSCNSNNAPLGIPGVAGEGVVLDPCPASEIQQMVMDGTNGTVWGPGLRQNFVTASANASSVAQSYYRTARIYNGGRFVANDLSQPCCTTSYASDVANRLLGWVHAPREFTCS